MPASSTPTAANAPAAPANPNPAPLPTQAPAPQAPAPRGHEVPSGFNWLGVVLGLVFGIMLLIIGFMGYRLWTQGQPAAAQPAAPAVTSLPAATVAPPVTPPAPSDAEKKLQQQLKASEKARKKAAQELARREKELEEKKKDGIQLELKAAKGQQLPGILYMSEDSVRETMRARNVEIHTCPAVLPPVVVNVPQGPPPVVENHFTVPSAPAPPVYVMPPAAPLAPTAPAAPAPQAQPTKTTNAPASTGKNVVYRCH